MDDLDKFMLLSYSNFEKALSYKGFVSDKEIKNIAIADFLRNILNDFQRIIPTEKEYNLVTTNLKKLAKNSDILPCTVTFKKYDINVDKDLINRLSENDLIQFTEDELLKLLN